MGFTSAGDAVLSEGHDTSELQETEQCNSPCARFFLLQKAEQQIRKDKYDSMSTCIAIVAR